MVNEAANRAGDYARKLALFDRLRRPVIRSAVEALELSPGSSGLDAGCGIGSHIPLLAAATAPDGRVTGLDISSDLLSVARETVRQHDLVECTSFELGDVNQLPFDDNSFDWAWSVDCAGYPFMGPRPVARELARVVKPGGKIAILGWTWQQVLPGYPLLEARLNAPSAVISGLAVGKKPESHFQRALGWLREAGLSDATARTFAGTVQGPLPTETRQALAALFEMLWEGSRPDIANEDWMQYERLCRLESPDCILNLPDYSAFFNYSMFSGRVSG